jgi:hypothetical protein
VRPTVWMLEGSLPRGLRVRMLEAGMRRAGIAH